MLKQVFGANRVLVDTEMGDSYTVYSAIKRPDLVVQHALGSGAHLVIDVKTVDGTGSTAIERSHTDVSALGRPPSSTRSWASARRSTPMT